MKALITQNQENREIDVYKDGQLSPEFTKAINDFSNNIVTAMSISAQQIIDFPKGEQIIQKMERDDECDSKQSIYFYPNCYFELQYVNLGLPYAKKGVIGMLMGFGEYGNEQGWADVSDYPQLLEVLKKEYKTAWQNYYDDCYADIPNAKECGEDSGFKLGE